MNTTLWNNYRWLIRVINWVIAIRVVPLCIQHSSFNTKRFLPQNFISHHSYIHIHFDSTYKKSITFFINNCISGQSFSHTHTHRRYRSHYNAVIFSITPHMTPLGLLFMASHEVYWASRPLLLRCPGHYRDICNIMFYLEHVITAPCSIAITQILAYIYKHLSFQIFA